MRLGTTLILNRYFHTGVAKGRKDVFTIFTPHIAGRVVVANGEPGTHVLLHRARSTVLGGATDLRGTDPDDLGVVTPIIEVGHIRGIFAIVGGWELGHLAVVPHVGDSLGQRFVLRDALRIGRGVHGNVLAVITAARSKVVREDARGGNVGGIASVCVAVRDRGSRVVGTVDIVLVDSSAGEVGS